jgi:hypothetical protein
MPSKAVTLDEAKAFLQKEGADGSTAYMHLAEVVLKIINEKPSESHELIEHISDGLKDEIATRRTKVPLGGEPGEQAGAATVSFPSLSPPPVSSTYWLPLRFV